MIQRLENLATQDQAAFRPAWSIDSGRDDRRRELTGLSGLQLAGLILDYGIMLCEESDPIEVILDYEFAQLASKETCLETISEH